MFEDLIQNYKLEIHEEYTLSPAISFIAMCRLASITTCINTTT